MDDNYYYIKSINDILFNNQVIDHFSKETNKIKKKEGMVVNPHFMIKKDSNIYNGQYYNYGFSTGKLLRSVFKDCLIFDDIYEFIDQYLTLRHSPPLLIKYAREQRQIAVHKYGFKDANTIRSRRELARNENENIVNHPCFLI